MSDTHQHPLSKWVIPDGDIFIHCGDFSKNKELQSIVDFNLELQKLPHKHKLVIAGNHDWAMQLQGEAARAELTAATYLEDSSVIIDGVKFYGCPWQPNYRNWAFNLMRHSLELKEKWAQVPDDVDVLISHTPPANACDLVWSRYEHVGCAYLRWRLESSMDSSFESSMDSSFESSLDSSLDSGLDSSLDSGLDSSLDSSLEPTLKSNFKPIVNVFGHIHEGRGTALVNFTLCVNASSVDLKHKVVPTVLVLDLDIVARTIKVVTI